MRGTALVINKDHTVTILENLDKAEYEKLNKKNQVVWCEGTIDFDYGY